MATQYTCSFKGVYLPPWLVKWSHHCSHMSIQVHSSWLPGYTDVVQTILIILTMAGLFLDRPHKRQKAKRHNSLEEPRSLRLVTRLVTISRFLNPLCSLAWTACGSWQRKQSGGLWLLTLAETSGWRSLPFRVFPGFHSATQGTWVVNGSGNAPGRWCFSCWKVIIFAPRMVSGAKGVWDELVCFLPSPLSALLRIAANGALTLENSIITFQ